MKKYMFVFMFSFSLSTLYALPGSTPKTYSQQDTIQAVQRLFDMKRSSGRSYMMVGCVNMIGSVLALPVGVPIAAVGVCTTSFGLIRKKRFSDAREKAILNNYVAGTALPNRIQRRLKAEYFE